ncbi:3-ketoacyl-CoA thiolase [wastewater metagenome]|uniref:acetyl-CoA C-acyltransferase n=2 Tax=unclassified sequences TaxID=12908 RepID=A0A5B8RD27_9ZZZZ|nr:MULTISPECIES: acetyl-CoA C-acyltransferase [Arhodomonas]MCS4503726.1 acetyl-CoA C-acyltransferase [Arhodomonas aquaeolei]QEA04675.1 3-ketoacyl-CoA thiolase [uncultured organism]
MSEMQDAYIVAAVRTPVGRAPRGALSGTRPDDLLAHVLRGAVDAVPELAPEGIEDVIAGCAMPEGSQGLNVARIAALLAGLPKSVPGVTVNRFCASGLESIAQAAGRIRSGEADCILAAGTESMSAIPWMGHRPSLNPTIFERDEDVGIAYGMGLTAERVAERYGVSREDQDAFALESHRRAVTAIDGGAFADEILPVTARSYAPAAEGASVRISERAVATDEGPRRDTDAARLAKLRPVFAARGSVTAGNSSQTSDGAGAVVVMSGRRVRELGITPMARFAGYRVVGVPPEIMGIGPVEAIPAALRAAGIGRDDLGWIELNEAFAAQSLAVMRELELDPARVNPLGGAIALGHPLGATGAVRTATLLHGLRRQGLRYGMVTMCVGTGMGAAGVFERC